MTVSPIRRSVKDLIPFLRQFKHLCACLLQRKPFVYRTRETLSLHFDLMVVQSEMRRDAPEELLIPYTQTMMGFLLFQPKPQRIAMIGLGGGSLAKYCYSKLPATSIVVAEINPRVIALRDEFQVPKNDARFQVLCADGADLVRDESAVFDVLMVDGFDRKGQSPQLCSASFYADCHRRLAPGGLLVVNLVVEDPFLERSIARIRHRFGTAAVVDSEDRTNRIAFARKGATLAMQDRQVYAQLGALERAHPVGLRSTLQRIRYEQYGHLPA